MSFATVQECREMLHAYMEAEKTILAGGQSYQIAGRSLTRANLKEIGERIVFWKGELSSAERRRRPRCRSVVPHG